VADGLRQRARDAGPTPAYRSSEPQARASDSGSERPPWRMAGRAALHPARREPAGRPFRSAPSTQAAAASAPDHAAHQRTTPAPPPPP
jgi:hypothetical protein